MNRFADSVFWCKNKFLRKKSYIAYKKALFFDKLSSNDKQNYTFSKLKKLVDYAYHHVPYYKHLYDEHNFKPSMLVTYNDWDKVPVLEKDIVRNLYKDLVSNEFEIENLSISTTSGSTGTPLKVYKEKDMPIEVMGWRSLDWWNISPADNMAKLHRNAGSTFARTIINQLLWWPTKRVFLNPISISSEKAIKKFVSDINRHKIIWMQGYCSLIETVADYILEHNLKTSCLRMVWCTSAPLTPLVRKKMEKAFGCRIMDQYGCNEMWNIAMQKKNEPYLTVCSDFVQVDTVDSNNVQTHCGELGDILITDLNCKAFPLIRYRLGDKGSFAKFSQDSEDGYPKLNFVKGRISDNIFLADGKGKIDGVFLTSLCDDFTESISAYQVYQQNDYHVWLRIVLRQGVSRDCQDIQKLRKKFSEAIKGDLSWNFEFLDKIPDYKGKKRYIISEINANIEGNKY